MTSHRHARECAALLALTVASCAPQLTANPIQLTPANQIALRDGTPIVRLIGIKGNPRATVLFIFPNGETLTGDAFMNADVKNTMTLWGQVPQTASAAFTITMVAVDQPKAMNCAGTISATATDLTCSFSDGAIYRNFYTAPPSNPPAITPTKHA